MGNVCDCCSEKASSPDTALASANNRDNPEETLENIFEDIKAEIDAENVDPRDVINFLSNLISHIKENKNPQNVEFSTTSFYGLVDKIAIKWEKYAKRGVPQELGKISGSFLKKIGEFDYILVGLSIVGSILRRTLKVHENKEACNEFIGNLSCLLAILDSHLRNNVEVSAMALQELADEIMNSITSCCKYATSAFGIRMLKSDALGEELKKTSQQLLAKVQNLQLDAELKEFYGIDQIGKKLDTMKTTHVQVAEDDVDENTVGIEQRVDKVKKLLRLEDKDIRAVAVVLHGQGGMGKSTLARSVITSAKPHLSHGFTVASVCFDSERRDLDTHKKELQYSILTQLSGHKTTVHSIKGGQSALRKVFCSKPCFVFVDNVVKCDQLSDFFPDSLPSDGSCNLRILVTSRDKDVENQLGFATVEIYSVDRLDHHSSVVSLRKYMGVPANSGQEKFSGEFEKIERIAELCYGTPILISTIGRDLKRKRDKLENYNDHCDEVIRRLEKADYNDYGDEVIREEGDLSNLKFEEFMWSVFNLLDERTKASFLDICKLMYMRRWDEVRDIIGDTTMEELSDRLMIRKDRRYGEDVVMIHDPLRAMALKLVETEKNRLVIYIDREVTDCLELSQLVDSDVCLNKIEGLFISRRFPLSTQSPTIYMEPEVFQRLRLLEIENLQVEFKNEDMEHIPSNLEYLAVSRGGQSRISILLKAEKSSTPLRALSLEYCQDDFLANMGKLLNLQSLRLVDCPFLRELPSCISYLVRLKRITLTACKNLEYLPDELGLLESLEELHLSECSKLRGVPISVVKWQHLKILIMSYCRNIQSLPEDMGMLKSLQYLELRGCESLECLPSKLAALVSLKRLDLGGCEIIEALPDDIGRLCCLKELILGGCSSLRKLPASVAGLKLLEILSIDNCYQLQRLPEDIGELSSLETLLMDNLFCLETLPSSLAKLSRLKWLTMEGCSSLRILPASIAGLKALEELSIDNCYQLQRLPEDIGELSSLKVLRMDSLSCLETLPSSLAKLSSPECLTMNGWSDMAILPDFIRNLYTLKKLYLRRCYNLKELPSYLEGFTDMEVLDLCDCEALEILPDVGKMGSLREINLAGCSKLQIIPPSIVELRHLEKVDISNCISIQNAGAFIQNMLKRFPKRGKDPSFFKYDGISEADSEAASEANSDD